jgi:aminoglycoside/choline kinase family phosphotransferase
MSEIAASAPAVPWPSPERRAAFDHWLAAVAPHHGLLPASLAPASADASFRRYLRIDSSHGRDSLIVMDAPPALEDTRPFCHVAGLIRACGLQAPEVLEADAENGFLLLSDLGQRPYLDALLAAQQSPGSGTADALMRPVLDALVRFQAGVPADTLPPFDEALLARELALFPEWCVQREFGISWTPAQQATWDRICQRLINNALAQPQVAVHADWMPRNLMLLPGADVVPGILDFQDAVRGPISYDLASLLRDAFISWDEPQEIDWAVRWWDGARRAGLPVGDDFGAFWQVLEWTGLQRHLKVLGIFCRLKHRDGKPRYAEDLPRFFAYANRVALRYGELKPLLALLEPMSGQRVAAGYTF